MKNVLLPLPQVLPDSGFNAFFPAFTLPFYLLRIRFVGFSLFERCGLRYLSGSFLQFFCPRDEHCNGRFIYAYIKFSALKPAIEFYEISIYTITYHNLSPCRIWSSYS